MVRKLKTLLIDDVRDLPVDEIARTYWDGIEALEKRGPWDLLVLDHDLGNYSEDGTELTGYDVVCWLEQNPQYLPKEIQLITANPVGRQRMRQVIERLYSKEPY